jgi:N utilization substance protein B
VRSEAARRRQARRRALAAVFEADFGQRTAAAVLERELEAQPLDELSTALARAIVEAAVGYRDEIDDRLGALAPAYPVVGLAPIDRALLRCALSEVLHCPATPTRVAIAEWVELARTFSGEPARRLVNGVLGRVATAMGVRSDIPRTEAPTEDDGTTEGRPARPRGGST